MTNRASFRMFTINEAANFFGLPKHFIRQLVLTKEIPSIKAGKKYLINEKKLENYLNSDVVHDIIGVGHQTARIEKESGYGKY